MGAFIRLAYRMPSGRGTERSAHRWYSSAQWAVLSSSMAAR